jgi:hypothetical protein
MISTDFFAAFRQKIIRITFYGSLFTPEGIFYNSSWADYGDLTVSSTSQFIALDTTDLENVQYFDTSQQKTIQNLIDYFAVDNIVAVNIPAASGGIGKILLYPDSPIEGRDILPSSGVGDATALTFTASSNNVSPTQSYIEACVQPLKGSELMVLPDGLRDKEIFKLWTTTKLHTVNNYSQNVGNNVFTGNYPDRLLISDIFYTVHDAKPWINIPIMGAVGGVSQYEYYITRWQPLATSDPYVTPPTGAPQ